nr:phage/plasmid replication protein [uncultured Carboxylicivirga sp.]
MYDNLDLSLTKIECPNINFLEVTPQYLTKVISEGESEFGYFITGYLDNAKIKISEYRVSFKDSSICKYYLDQNFKTLSKGDIRRAIEKLSDSLHLPFNLANVTRIDLAQNMIMQYEEHLYYPYLGTAPYYNRLEQNNGLYYQNNKRTKLFYGKVHEQKIKKKQIPELYRGKNVLRFELRFIERLREQLKQPQITAELLYNESFYINLVKRWRDEYLSIQKINSKLRNMKPTGSTKELIEHMALIQLLEHGQPHVLAIIKEWQEQKLITKKQAQDHRNKIKKLASQKADDKGNELINELTRKVKEAARFP